MFEKLESAEQRYEEIGVQLTRPEIINDTAQYTKLSKEYSSMTPIVEKYREYRSAVNAEKEARELLDAGGLDKDFKELVEEEFKTALENIKIFSEELKVLLLPKDPNDDKNVIVEIRAGAGGEESALFAGVLFRMYSMYAEKKRWKTEILSSNPTELGGFKEVSFMISGEGADRKSVV